MMNRMNGEPLRHDRLEELLRTRQLLPPVEIEGRVFTETSLGRFSIDTGLAIYHVDATGGSIVCTCPAGRRRRQCRHADAVAEMLAAIENAIIDSLSESDVDPGEPPIDDSRIPF